MKLIEKVSIDENLIRDVEKASIAPGWLLP
jgi:hypothetical protein